MADQLTYLRTLRSYKFCFESCDASLGKIWNLKQRRSCSDTVLCPTPPNHICILTHKMLPAGGKYFYKKTSPQEKRPHPTTYAYFVASSYLSYLALLLKVLRCTYKLCKTLFYVNTTWTTFTFWMFWSFWQFITFDVCLYIIMWRLWKISCMVVTDIFFNISSEKSAI